MDLRQGPDPLDLNPHQHHNQHQHHGHAHGSGHLERPPDASEYAPKSGHEGHSMPSQDHNSHSMTMAFHASERETILFEFWRTQTALSLALSCLFIFVVAVLYEALKFYREWLFNRRKRRLEAGMDYSNFRPPHGQRNHYQPPHTQTYVFRPSIPPISPLPSITPASPLTHSHIHPQIQASGLTAADPTSPRGNRSPERAELPKRKIWFSKMHILQTFLHMLQVFISFLLMLVFMTFNVWLCLAVVLGAGVGYFIFFAYSTNLQEHCN